LLLSLAWPTGALAAPRDAYGVRRVRVIEASRLGVAHPVGLAFARRADRFVVLPQGPSRTDLRLVTHEGRPGRAQRLPAAIEDPLNATFDNKAHRLVFYDAKRLQILEVAAGRDGIPDPASLTRHPAGHYRIERARGMAADPATGRLFVLDAAGPRLVVIEPEADGSLARARGSWRELGGFAPGPLQGLAFDPASGNLHVYGPGEERLYEVTDQGLVVAHRDLSAEGLREPQALLFAPSGDSTDDPTQTSLYVADAGGAPEASGATAATATAGQLIEISIQATMEPAASTATATLVQVIDTSAFTPPSPDAMGIAYIDAWDRLLMSDSEVNEIPSLFTGDNLFEIDHPGGTLHATASTIDFSNEPTGVAFDPVRGHIFISHDDSGGRLFVVDSGSDGIHFTVDDEITTISTGSFGSGDPEGITFDRVRRSIFISDGVDSEVYELDPGENGIFGDSDDQTSHFDTASLGVTDPEAITYDTLSGNLYLLGNPRDQMLEVTPSGAPVRTIDVSAADPPNPSGLAYGPSSENPSLHSVYISDRGVDNNRDPDENDGQLFEVSFSGSAPANPPPVSTLGTVGRTLLALVLPGLGAAFARRRD
jgi:DNA-binding beta-propeller fold protein YncE